MDKTRLIEGMLGVLTVIAVGTVLKFAQGVFLPLVIAWLLSYVLAPAIRALTRLRLPHGLSVALVVLLVLAVCYLAGVFLQGRTVALVRAYPRYEARLMELAGLLTARFEVLQFPLADINWGARVGAVLMSLSGSLVNFISKLVMVIIFLIFLLLGKPYFKYKLARALTHNQAGALTHMLESISGQISRYLAIQLLISAVTGVLVWAALRLVGVDFPVTWGALAFFLNFIPTVGSILATIPPILLAIIQFFPNWWPGILTLVALLGIQMTIGNVIAPKVMGDRLNLSPLVVLLSLVFWGWLWGFVGALLSVPIASALKIVCENIEPLKPIAILMSSGKRYRPEAPAAAGAP